jgi:hypothetical protein
MKIGVLHKCRLCISYFEENTGSNIRYTQEAYKASLQRIYPRYDISGNDKFTGHNHQSNEFIFHSINMLRCNRYKTYLAECHRLYSTVDYLCMYFLKLW